MHVIRDSKGKVVRVIRRTYASTWRNLQGLFCGETDIEVTDCNCKKCFTLRSEAYRNEE